MRMMHERESWQDTCFITLTYDQENLPSRGLRKKDLQDFWKRLRKRVTHLRYFACGEYGERTKRPHYHAIVYGVSKVKALEVLPLVWTKGHIDVGEAEEDSVRYVAGYIDKKWMEGDQKSTEFMGMTPPFQACSQALGKTFLLENATEICRDGLVFRGKNQAMPRYYVEKLKIWFPGQFDSAWMKREDERIIREADETLEILPETGGKQFIELTEYERNLVSAVRKEKGHNMQAHLKAKARIYSLKKLEKGKSL